MLNYWWVTRPKRKLNSVPEVLATFADLSLNEEWNGQRDSHLAYEEALEVAGLKRKGERRDHTGGGARTYKAWLVSLGLIFTQESTGRIKLTLAGEAIMNGESPVKVLTNQILKYQFPSAFSVSRGVQVASRFKIRPFRFLLRLLSDNRIQYLTEEEIAKIVVTEAETESKRCFEYIVDRIIQFRSYGDACLEEDFLLKYQSSKGGINLEHPYSHLLDLANTLVNWLEYTQLVKREDKKVAILDEKQDEINIILQETTSMIDRPENHEYFQRKYGVDLKHKKDSRDLTKSATITPCASIIVQTINQRNGKNLSFDDYKDGLRMIAVGGMSLSRGLTLEGLVISYFYRNSKMYDTLMQMGRWFGYRNGYADLCRIWMSDESIEWYKHISQATVLVVRHIQRHNLNLKRSLIAFFILRIQHQ